MPIKALLIPMVFVAFHLSGCSNIAHQDRTNTTLPALIIPGWIADFPIDIENAKLLRGDGTLFFKSKNFSWSTAYQNATNEAKQQGLSVTEYFQQNLESSKKIPGYKITKLAKEGLNIYLIENPSGKALIYTADQQPQFIGDISVLGDTDINLIFKSIRRRK